MEKLLGVLRVKALPKLNDHFEYLKCSHNSKNTYIFYIFNLIWGSSKHNTIKRKKKIELFIIIDLRGVFTHQKGKMGYSGEIFFGGKLPNIGSKYALD